MLSRRGQPGGEHGPDSAQQELIIEPDENCHCASGQRTRRANQCTSLRAVALTLFLLASLFWCYKVYTNATGGHDLLGWDSYLGARSARARSQALQQSARLRLISVFNRHGDRAPSDALPPGDDIAPKTRFFWPRGLTNLTETGRFRQFRLGLELRKRYARHLDYEAAHFLALSSPMERCRESLELTLAGLFDIEWTLARGLELVRRHEAACAANTSSSGGSSSSSSSSEQAAGNRTTARPSACNITSLHLPGGSGSPLEYKQIAIDSSIMPMLEYKFLNTCKYRLEHPTPVDADLLASPAVAQLPGLRQLEEVLAGQYQAKLNFSALGLWSTLAGELRLARTSQSIAYGQHLFRWATREVAALAHRAADKDQRPAPTLFDLYEQVAVLGYRDRIVDTARLIQLGPLITSLVRSQEAALHEHAQTAPPQAPRTPPLPPPPSFDSHDLYRNRRAVIYSSHDSILQLLMHQLGIVRANASEFERQFNRWHAASDADQLLAGLRMSQFGMSLVFELYEIQLEQEQEQERKESQARFAYLQAALYNEADGKYKPVEFKRLELGRVCKRLFAEQNFGAPADAFYQRNKFRLDDDEALYCPFDLFRNVTRSYLISAAQLNKLCTAGSA